MATLATEMWIGTTGAAWPTQWTVTHQTGTGSDTIQSNSGQMVTAASAYATERAYLSGMSASVNTDIVFTFTVPTQAESYINIGLNTDTSSYGADSSYSNNGYYVTIDINATAANGAVELTKMLGGIQTSLAANVTMTLIAGTAYRVRINRNSSTIRWRLWTASATEPTSWTGTYTDPGTLPPAGAAALNFQSGSTAASRSVLFNDLIVTTDGTISLPYTDTWTDVSGSAWPPTWTVAQSAGSGGTASVTSSSGVLYAGTTSSSGMKAYLTSMVPAADTDISLSFTITTQVLTYFNVQICADNTQYSGNPGEMPNNGYTLNFNANATAANGSFDMWKMVAGSPNQIYATTTLPIPLTAGTSYNVRFQRFSTNIRFRFWLGGSAEPTTWTASYSDPGTLLPANNVAVSVNNVTTTPQTITYDNLMVMVPGATMAWFHI